MNYPGRKKLGDYRLEILHKKVPRHDEICLFLYDLVKQEKYTYEKIYAVLERTYNYGTKKLDADKRLNYLQHLIYWVTLQAVSYTHLDVYKRQFQQSGDFSHFSRHSRLRYKGHRCSIGHAASCLLYTSRCV